MLERTIVPREVIFHAHTFLLGIYCYCVGARAATASKKLWWKAYRGVDDTCFRRWTAALFGGSQIESTASSLHPITFGEGSTKH